MPGMQAQIRVTSDFDLTDGVLAGAEAVLAYAQSIVPVVTGELQNSGHVVLAGRNHAVVIFSAEHASYVEQGTRNMDAQPYLGVALDVMLPNVLGILAEQEREQARIAEIPVERAEFIRRNGPQ